MADDLAHARALARVLDHYLVDPLLGFLLPGIGDVIGSVDGLYVVGVAVRRRVSPIVIARMLLNLGADTVLGLVPIVGDVIDFGFHANERNIRLLTERSATGGRSRRSDWLAVGGALVGFVGIVCLVVWGVVVLVRHL